METASKENQATYRFEAFELDQVRRVLLRDGKPVALKPEVFETLLVLVRNSGRVMDKDELMQQVWPDTVVEEVNLAHNISMLRKALGQKSDGSRFIITVPGRGYGFVAEVRPTRQDERSTEAEPEYELTRAPLVVQGEPDESGSHLVIQTSDDRAVLRPAKGPADKRKWLAFAVGLPRL